MDADSTNKLSRRSPQWRVERALHLAEHLPRPLSPASFDDRYVRAYRRYLIAVQEAGWDIRGAILAEPHVHWAHVIRFTRNKETQYILQASILAGETTEAGAARIGTEAKVVEYYHKLFFDVRRRLGPKPSLEELIVGSPLCLGAGRDGMLTMAQRGFLYRLFAYLGGPQLLDVCIDHISAARMPTQRDEAAAGLHQAADTLADRCKTLDTNSGCDISGAIRLLALAAPPRSAADRRKWPPSDFEKFVERVVARLHLLETVSK